MGWRFSSVCGSCERLDVRLEMSCFLLKFKPKFCALNLLFYRGFIQ